MTHKYYPGTDFQTADGREVEIYKVTDEYIDGFVRGEQGPARWNPDGSWNCVHPADRDLIPKPRKVTLQECWVVYSADGEVWTCCGSEGVARRDAESLPGFIRHIPAEEREI